MSPLKLKPLRPLGIFGSLFWAAMAAQGAPSLNVGSASGSAGSSVNTVIQFDPGGASISSLQFNLTLPASISTVSFTAGSVMVAASKMAGTQLNGNLWTFVIFGINQSALGLGDLLTVTTQIAPGTSPGTRSLPISGTVYSDPNGVSIAGGSSTGGSITVTPNSLQTTATPTFSPSGGPFTSTVQVTLQTLTPSALIYYTVDGSNPSISSTLYGGPITLSQTTTLKAFAQASGMNPSAVASALFTRSSGSVASLPVPSLIHIPSFLTLSSQLNVAYDPTLNVSFLWTFQPQGPGSPVSAHAGTGQGVTGQSATFKSGSQTATLASYGLTVGTYWVSVQAVDNADPSRLSPSATMTLTLVVPDFNDLRVFPNPWRKNSHAGKPVTFDRLPVGSTLKLFTVAGHWVKTLKASSDTILWDLTNDQGQSVASGHYIYLITSDQGQQTTGQIAVVK